MRWRFRPPSLSQLVYELRTEGGGPVREAAAIGLGVFIGCTPFYGFHLILVLLVGRWLRLNRFKMYLASNISNPLLAPALIFVQIQFGAWLRRNEIHDLSLDAFRAHDPFTFGADFFVGSMASGVVLGFLLAVATYASAGRGPRVAAHVSAVLDRAADRYLPLGIAKWEMARGKLRRDPVYAACLIDRWPTRGTLVDIGCGRGLVLALFTEARKLHAAGLWPADADAPPAFDGMIGIEIAPRVADIARRALGDEAIIVLGDARAAMPDTASAVVLFDVLHLIPTEGQEALLAAIAEVVPPGGVLFVREVDAAAGAGFRLVRLGNRIKNTLVGNWRVRFHFRTAAEWQALFARHGFEGERRPMGAGTPFANVLFRVERVGATGPDQRR